MIVPLKTPASVLLSMHLYQLPETLSPHLIIPVRKHLDQRAAIRNKLKRHH